MEAPVTLRPDSSAFCGRHRVLAIEDAVSDSLVREHDSILYWRNTHAEGQEGSKTEDCRDDDLVHSILGVADDVFAIVILAVEDVE